MSIASLTPNLHFVWSGVCGNVELTAFSGLVGLLCLKTKELYGPKANTNPTDQFWNISTYVAGVYLFLCAHVQAQWFVF